MIKLICFKDCNAVWSDQPLQSLNNIVCRRIDNIDILPIKSILHFNCNESELANVTYNKDLFYQKIKTYIQW